MNLGADTDLYGRFVAREITGDFDVNVTFRQPVPEPTSALLFGAGLSLILLTCRRSARAS